MSRARLSELQEAVLSLVMVGDPKSPRQIAHELGRPLRDVQHSLDALTRRNLATPIEALFADMYYVPTRKALARVHA